MAAGLDVRLVEDRRLLEGFRRGESWALAEVYRHYAPALARLLRAGFSFDSRGRHCRFHGARTPFDLEDRLQEVFARAFSPPARESYDGLQPYEPYLFRIARNAVIDDFRRKERALVEYSVEPPDVPSDPVMVGGHDPFEGAIALSGHPDLDAENAELTRLVAEFEAGLPQRESLVYKLRFRERLEHRDIRARTGLSDSKIKTSEQRIRQQFFEFMQQRGFFQGYTQHGNGWLRLVRGWSGGQG